MRDKKLKWLIIVIVALIVIGIIPSKKDGQEEPTESDSEQSASVTDVETSQAISYGLIDDFSYEISADRVLLDPYKGRDPVLEIRNSYEINGISYKTDISRFRVRSGAVKTIIFDEGFTEVYNPVFNSSEVKSVYFPRSMTVIYDNTLAYLHSDGVARIKIYYGGTQDEWLQIFSEYEPKTMEEAEDAAEKGRALADKANRFFGMEYNDNDFEYFFSANPEDLK